MSQYVSVQDQAYSGLQTPLQLHITHNIEGQAGINACVGRTGEPEDYIDLECACGCRREIKDVPRQLLEDVCSGRAKREFWAKGYCDEYACFMISACGYFYASLRCLNSINEEG